MTTRLAVMTKSQHCAKYGRLHKRTKLDNKLHSLQNVEISAVLWKS